MTEQGRSDPIGDESTTAFTRATHSLLATAALAWTICCASRRFSRRGALETIGTVLAGVLASTSAAGADDTSDRGENGNGDRDGDGDDSDQHDDDPDDEDGDEDGGERYVVGLEPGTATESVLSPESRVTRSLDLESTGRVVVGAFDDETRQELESTSTVRYVERDRVRRPSVRSSADASNTVDLSDEQHSPWGIERIGATDLHGSGQDGDGGTVAVLDSGIDPDHESLEVADGEAFTDCSGSSCAADWDDETGHGTHCAGTIGALDNGTGVVGAVPGVDLCALKVLAGDGSGYDSDIAAAIEWCADNDIDVVNLSLGGSDPAQVLEDALAYAYERGVLVVAAAGNDGSIGGIDYPAAYDECIAVGATDEHDEVPDWSARGDGIELVAPGEEILSTKPDDEYVSLDGTSMATPHVAAIGAQLLSQGLPHAEDIDDVDDPGGVRGVLRETAADVGFDDDEQGYGLLDAFDALADLEPVVTEDATEVRATTATLNGSIRSLEVDAEDEGAVFFQWREGDSDEWHETDPEPLADVDDGGGADDADESDANESDVDDTNELGRDADFAATVDDLEPETTYDVRAVLEDDDETTSANVVTVETGRDELAVETGDVEAGDHRTLEITGDLEGLGDADDVAVACDVRLADGDEWETTDTQSLEAIGSFEDTVSGLEPETAYEVRVVAEGDAETATGETVTAETDPEPGHPEIERFEPTDDSTDQFVRCNVHWRVTDRDESLELVETELRYADDDETLHRIATEVEGDAEDSGVHTVRHSDRLEGAGETYDVILTATDADGNVTEETEQLTLDERSAPPEIDRFETSVGDFLGTPEVEVEWAVSDEGDELDGVDLELCPAGDDEPVDTASAMARGDEASGTDSLRDRDGEAGTYEVTISATDYFEQTTEETTQVDLEE